MTLEFNVSIFTLYTTENYFANVLILQAYVM